MVILDLEATGSSPATGALEFTAFGFDVGFLVAGSQLHPQIEFDPPIEISLMLPPNIPLSKPKSTNQTKTEKSTNLPLMRPKPKMLNRLPRILRPPKQQRILPRRLPKRQLIQRQTLPTSLLNPRACRGGEMQCRDSQGFDFEQACVVRDGADHDEGFLGRERRWRRERDMGGRLMREVKRRRRMTRLNGEEVRPVEEIRVYLMEVVTKVVVGKGVGSWGMVGGERGRTC